MVSLAQNDVVSTCTVSSSSSGNKESHLQKEKAPICHDPIDATRPERRPNAEHLTPFQPTFLHRHEVTTRPRKPPPIVQR